jgi:hypothetical protein
MAGISRGFEKDWTYIGVLTENAIDYDRQTTRYLSSHDSIQTFQISGDYSAFHLTTTSSIQHHNHYN